MKRYLKFIAALVTISSKAHLEHRWGIVGIFLNTVIAIAVTLFFVGIFYNFTNDLNGWTKYQVFFLVGVFRIMMSLASFLFIRGVNFLPKYVVNGELDLILNKPVNSQLYISLRYTRLYELMNIFASLGIVFYSLKFIEGSIPIINLIVFLMTLLAGLVIFYGIYFSIATIVLWIGQFNAFGDFFYIIREPLSVPMDIFGKTAGFLLTFIIPLGFIVTVPVSILFGKNPLILGVGGVLIAILVIYFSHWFWNFSLRHYSSASS